MSRKYKDLTGMKFGYLTVIKRIEDHIEPSGRKVAVWECLCDCGNIKNVYGKHLKGGDVQSCGCLQKERPNGTTHGMSGTDIWNHWKYMRQRCDCRDEKSLSYKNYYLKGITYCKEWEDFEPFYEWAVQNGYREGLTLERKDNNGGYCPSNCCWADMETQANNRSNNNLITYNGKTQTETQWAREIGIRPQTLWSRIHTLGWDIEKSLTTIK